MVNPNGSPDRKAEKAEGMDPSAFDGMSNDEIREFAEELKTGKYDGMSSGEEMIAAYKNKKNKSESGGTSAELKKDAEKRGKNQKRGGTTIAAALLAGTLLTNYGGKIANSFINNEKSQPTPEPTQDTSGVTAEESTASYYGESNPYEITIGSEERDDFGLGEYTGNEKLNSVLNQSGKQFYLPGEYNYKKSEKVTPNAVANPKEIYKFMGVDPNNPSIEDKADAIKYTTYSQGFVSSGIATFFARAGNAPEGFTKDYDANQDHVYEMEKGGEERLAHEAWLKDVFENSTFKETTINNSELHLYGNEKDIREDGNIRGIIAKGDTKQRNVIEQVYTNPEDGSEMTFFWQEECHNLFPRVIHKTKEGKTTTVTLIPETSTTTTTNPGPAPGPKPTPRPTPEITPTPEYDDTKNSEAIGQNMQTHEETNNYVAPTGPGEVEARPDTSTNSYEDEQQYQIGTTEQAWSAPSESAYYETVGEVIENADQTLADHTNYTPEQVQEKVVEQQNQSIQTQSNNNEITSSPISGTSEDEKKAEASDWYNNLINGGGQ